MSHDVVEKWNAEVRIGTWVRHSPEGIYGDWTPHVTRSPAFVIEGAAVVLLDGIAHAVPLNCIEIPKAIDFVNR